MDAEANKKRAEYQRKYYHAHKHDPVFLSQKKKSAKKYRNSEKGKEAKLRNPQKKYKRKKTPKYLAAKKAYKQTAHYKEWLRKYQKRYYQRQRDELNELRSWKESQESFFQSLAMAEAIQKAV